MIISTKTRGVNYKTNDTVLTSKIENGGFSNQTTLYSLSSKIKKNKPTIIATIKVDAPSGYYFTEVPYLSPGQNLKNSKLNVSDILKLSIVSVEKEAGSTVVYKDSSRIISYLFNVTCLSSKNIKLISEYKWSLIKKTEPIPTKVFSIDSVNPGKIKINSNGEIRDIKIKGIWGTSFTLSLNNVIESKETLSDGTTRVVNSSEKSILSPSVSNSSFIDNNGNTISTIEAVIDETNLYSFKQLFPKIPTILKTAFNGAHDGSSTTIILDTTAGVEVGDLVVSSAIKSGLTIKVLELVSTTRLVTSSAITADDNTVVSFKRGAVFNLNVFPTLDSVVDGIPVASSSLGSSVPTTTPTYKLYQYLNPTLTLRASTADITSYKINAQNLPGSGRQQYDISYVGRPDISSSKLKHIKDIKSTFSVTYLLDSESAKTFTAARTPSWSNFLDYDGTGRPDGTPAGNGSDWTNSTNKNNKGTNIIINNINFTATGAETITLTFNVDVQKWGTEDVVFDLDLDKILTIQ